MQKSPPQKHHPLSRAFQAFRARGGERTDERDHEDGIDGQEFFQGQHRGDEIGGEVGEEKKNKEGEEDDGAMKAFCRLCYNNLKIDFEMRNFDNRVFKFFKSFKN